MPIYLKSVSNESTKKKKVLSSDETSIKRNWLFLWFGTIGRGQSTCLHPLCSQCVSFLVFLPTCSRLHVFMCVLIWMLSGSLFCFVLFGDDDVSKNLKLLSDENLSKKCNTLTGWKRFSPDSRILFIYWLFFFISLTGYIVMYFYGA